MFGFGDDRTKILLMAGIIRGANRAFDLGIATTAALRRCELPHYDDRYLGVILGFSEYVGRVHRARDSETTKSLQSFLSDYPDGEQIHQKMKMIAVADTQVLFRMQAGLALSNSLTENGTTAAMMKLAAILFDN